MKLSTCNVCSKKIFFLGSKCNVCKYKCHKECVQNAPANCGFSEGKLRRVIDNNDIQNAFAKSSPLSRKYHFTASDSTSPTCSTPLSAPGSPAPHPGIPISLFNSSIPNGHPSICVSESIYCGEFFFCLFLPFLFSFCMNSLMTRDQSIHIVVPTVHPTVLEYCIKMNRSICE